VFVDTTLSKLHQSIIINLFTILKNLLLLLLLLFSFFSVQAQVRKPLKGKITSDTDDLEGIYVINKTADITVATSKGGYFRISVQPRDTLIFSAIQFVAKQVVVEQENIDAELFFVPLQTMVKTLDEAIVSKSNITSESLGLVPKGQKRYTPGERKVYTATQGIDAIFNAISGRTKMLKKAVEYEKKEILMEKINYIYTEEELIEQFKIPQEYVRGFVYYVVEDKEFAGYIKAKNNGMAKFALARLAVEYLSIINEDKKPDDK